MIGVPNVSGSTRELEIYAISILAGTVIQVLLPFPWLAGRDGRLQLVIDWRDPAVHRVFKLMLPVTLGLGLINVNLVIDSLFAARLIDPTLSPSAIDAAFRIYMLPQGMFSVAIATVLFPSLARFASRRDYDGFRRTVSTGLRQIAFLLVPASAAAAVLAQPIVRLLYQRGDFTAAQTPVVAASLAAFAAGLAFNGAMLMLNRAFFSLQSNWVPTWVALGNLFVNAGLDAAFYRVGTWGIPLSTTLVNVAGTVALLWLLRRRLGRIELAGTIATTTRIVAASAALAGVCYGVWLGLDRALGREIGFQVVSVGVALAAGALVYLGACRALRVRELDTLLSLATSCCLSGRCATIATWGVPPATRSRPGAWRSAAVPGRRRTTRWRRSPRSSTPATSSGSPTRPTGAAASRKRSRRASARTAPTRPTTTSSGPRRSRCGSRSSTSARERSRSAAAGWRRASGRSRVNRSRSSTHGSS